MVSSSPSYAAYAANPPANGLILYFTIFLSCFQLPPGIFRRPETSDAEKRPVSVTGAAADPLNPPVFFTETHRPLQLRPIITEGRINHMNHTPSTTGIMDKISRHEHDVSALLRKAHPRYPFVPAGSRHCTSTIGSTLPAVHGSNSI